MSSSVEKIKEKLSITDVLSSYLKLEKAGASYKAKCPFHNEKTPSFFVSPDRGTYYCFGCGAKGDMFTFVEQFEGLEFKQALKNLADKAGVELVPERPGERDERDKLFRAVEMAAEFFEGELAKNKAALEYLRGRGLTDATIANWRIGYAPNEWHALGDHLKARKISEADQLAVGLIKRNDVGGFHDVFRGRIMFPIFDQTGRPVAFSGRIFVDDDKAAKYLNSPATVLFNKSETLYGFDRAKNSIRKLNYSILVEGQMDLIMSHQAGLVNTVASSGTALTELHLQKLLRLSPRVMFAFDSDSAGFNATKKSAELALGIGMEVKVAVLPEGEDPASLVAKDPNLWKQALKAGKHIIDFYTDSLLARVTDRRVLSREIKSNVLPFVLKVQSKTEQAQFVKRIAEKAGIKEQSLWDDLNSPMAISLSKTANSANGPNLIARPILPSRKQGIERRLFGIIFWKEGQKSAGSVGEMFRKRLNEIVGEPQAKAMEEEIIGEKEKLIFEAEQYYDQSANFERDIEELLINLEEEVLKSALSQKMMELQRAEVQKDTSRAQNLLAECQSITNKIEALRKRPVT